MAERFRNAEMAMQLVDCLIIWGATPIEATAIHNLMATEIKRRRAEGWKNTSGFVLRDNPPNANDAKDVTQ